MFINKLYLFFPQKNTCILPEDLRDFYLTTDGLTITWSVKLDGRCSHIMEIILQKVYK